MEPQYQILDYLYSSGGSMGLPEENVVDLHDYEAIKTSGVYYTQVNIQNNWNDQLDEAEDVKADYVNTYWAILIIAGAAALMVGVILGLKFKPVLAVVIFIVIIIAIILGGLLFAGTSFYTTDRTAELADSNDINDINEGEDNKDDGDNQEPDGGPGGAWREMEDDEGTNAADWKADDDAPPAPTPPLGPEGEEDDGDGYQPSGNGTAPGSEHVSTHIREYFPETWYWNPVLITDENGEVELELITPDSITTWEITGMANTMDGKLGMNHENLTVFQRFFIEPDLPVSVIRNDTFPLKIMVYNYDDVDHDIWVYLHEDDWFDLLTESPQKVTVQADNVSKVTFTIQAKEVGEHDLSMSGYQTDDNLWDDVIKSLRVDPDGKLVDETINGKLTDSQTDEIELELSSDRVPKSENAYVKLQGGMEAVILDGAESFIQFVSGCGEQSMSTLNIDVLAFDTVTSLNTATEEKMAEYEGIVTQGIQHELQYLVDAKNNEGRGIVWFPEDEDVHPWLTSWGLITFQDAITAGFNIDQDIITDMQTWLISQQNEDGSFEFPERGLYEFTNPILKSKEFSASAYITRALLYSGYSSTSTYITEAVTYLEDNVYDHWDDPLTLSLTLLVLEQANGNTQTRDDIATRIDELKNDDAINGTVFWGSGTSMITDSDIRMEGGWGYSGANYHTIETTGYCLMALSVHGSYRTTVEKAVKYLIENRKALGGWFATQDTIVAFQALKAGGQNNIDDLTVKIYADNNLVSTTTFTDYNKDLTYLIDLRPYLKETTKIKLESTGTGSVMYQVYCGEYIPWDIIGVDEPPELLLDITYDSTNIKVDDKLEATLTLKYIGSASHIKMILIDLRAPVGFSFVEDDFQDMADANEISSFEINDRQAYLYIEDLQYDTNYTLVYHLLANDPIKGTIQGINAFDMYNTDLNAEVEPVELESHL
jgi:CD109 antigen